MIKLREEYEDIVKRLEIIIDPSEKKKELENNRKRYFYKFDEFLNKHSYKPTWLKDERIAQIVATAIHVRENSDYELIAYSIMPNHVHMVVSLYNNDKKGRNSIPSESDEINHDKGMNNNRTEVRFTPVYKNYRLTDILRRIKGSTAREANKILKRSGAFWQHESYDHVIKDGKELDKIVWYVLNNPVKAGYVDDWQKWKWNYCKFEM